MHSSDSNTQQESTSFNPLAWGILFFTFWLTLKTIPQLSSLQNGLAWFSVVISFILWISIILPPWRKILQKPSVKRVYLPSIFLISLTAYVMSLVGSLPAMKGIDIDITVYFGFVWLATYLVILIRTSKQEVGIAGGVLFAIAGIYHLVNSNIIGGIVLLVLGIIGIIIAIKRPKMLWHESTAI